MEEEKLRTIKGVDQKVSGTCQERMALKRRNFFPSKA
jgi:hypothetical protein